MSELAKRVVVASVGIPVVLTLLYFGSWFAAVPLAGLAAGGTGELYRMAEARDVRPARWVGLPASAALVLLATWRPSYADFAPYALAVVALVAAVASLGAMRARGPEGRPLAAVSVTVVGPIYVGLAFAVVPLLMALPAGRGWIATSPDRWAGLLVMTLPLAATWIGDAAAYFAGRAWGRSKLAPTISPNKSWVGFWATLVGASAAAVVWHAVVGAHLPGVTRIGVLWLVPAGALLGLAAVIGDLVESLFKREAGVKDSGSFFPGHGGVLDRLDSLVFTIPTAYVVLELLGRLP